MFAHLNRPDSIAGVVGYLHPSIGAGRQPSFFTEVRAAIDDAFSSMISRNGSWPQPRSIRISPDVSEL